MSAIHFEKVSATGNRALVLGKIGVFTIAGTIRRISAHETLYLTTPAFDVTGIEVQTAENASFKLSPGHEIVPELIEEFSKWRQANG